MLRALRAHGASLAKGLIPSMTTTLIAPTCVRTQPRQSSVQRAVLTIHGMPRHLRLRVEELMAVHLSPPAALGDGSGSAFGVLDPEDIWDTIWFTRWRNDSSNRTIACREVIVAPAHELSEFRAHLAELSGTFRFHASV